MDMPIAIIDLGSNTFKLLIAELNASQEIKIIHESTYSCMLAKNGTQGNKISPEAFEKGLNNIEEILSVVNTYKTSNTYVYATSIIRSSENGNFFIEQIEDKFSIKVEIIDGNREAELIYKGTKHAIALNKEKVAILDIGGGSCEIIIANNEKIYWKKSFNLGIRRIIEKFKPSEPILKNEQEEIQKYIQEEIAELADIAKYYKIKTLIGTAGTFDSLRKLLKINTKTDNYCEIKLDDYYSFHHNILKGNISNRKQLEGIVEARAELLVVACIFIKEILITLDIKKMYQSSYSLKEGAFFENTQK